jgi:predicted amidohydrolase
LDAFNDFTTHDFEFMKATLIQSDIVWENIPANLDAYREKILAADKTDLIALPEMFATGFTMQPEQFAQSSDGSIMQFLKEMAAETGAALAASYACCDAGKYYNRFIFMRSDGTYQTYDKRHLFAFAGENRHYTGGNERVIINYKGFRIFPQICYDLRFPVWSRNRGDYDMLLYVANWPARRRNAWRILLQARAHENQAFVIGVNRTGNDGNGIDHSGDSMIVDPRGNLLMDLSSGREETQIASLDINEVARLRDKFRAADDADKFEIID